MCYLDKTVRPHEQLVRLWGIGCVHIGKYWVRQPSQTRNGSLMKKELLTLSRKLTLENIYTLKRNSDFA